MRLFLHVLAGLFLLLTAFPASAATEVPASVSSHWAGGVIFVLFVLAYGVAIFEEQTHMRKSKPVTLVAGLIWIFVFLAYNAAGQVELAVEALNHTTLEYAQLLLFLLSAMTYINTLEERGLFNALRARLVALSLNLRKLFWVCGGLAFVMSPIADNLTTALVLGSVTLSVGKSSTRFIVASLINIVVAANAGGVFSPFGDVTTLMVWQKGVVDFLSFFSLFFPALVSWLIPAFFLARAVPESIPDPVTEKATIKKGGIVVAILFVTTIGGTVLLHHWLGLPPFLGMMTGLGLLKIYGFTIRNHELRLPVLAPETKPKAFDIFISLNRIEWDTLMFFFGVMLSVGGLVAMGQLSLLSAGLYGTMGESWTHIVIGLLSALIDNIPVMFAVLNMEQNHSLGQWLLVTLTAGIGGSLLSIGSAAGIALMGQARGIYTFKKHFRWSWAILLGYAAGVGLHFLLNASLF